MAKYLIHIVIDGVRFSDTWGTPANIPNMNQMPPQMGNPMAGGLRNAYRGGGLALQKRPFGQG